MVASIVLAVYVAMNKDVRWLLIVALPFAAYAVLAFTHLARLKRPNLWTAAWTVFSIAGFFALFERLPPSGEGLANSTAASARPLTPDAHGAPTQGLLDMRTPVAGSGPCDVPGGPRYNLTITNSDISVLNDMISIPAVMTRPTLCADKSKLRAGHDMLHVRPPDEKASVNKMPPPPPEIHRKS
jgi:hypothetical protein